MISCSVLIAMFIYGDLPSMFVNAIVLQYFASQLEKSSVSLLFPCSTPGSDHLRFL